MKQNVPRLLVLVTLLFSAIVFSACEAHAQQVQVKERLPDGEFIVVIDGVEQRTIKAEHARDIIERDEKLERCSSARVVLDKQVVVYENTLGLLKRDRELADRQAQLERERAMRFQTMFEGEQALRLQAEKLHRPRGRVTAFFENPFVQVATKLALPVAQSFVRRE